LIFAEVVYTFFPLQRRRSAARTGSRGFRPRAWSEASRSTTPLRNYYLVLVYLGLGLPRLSRARHLTLRQGASFAIRENEDRARFLGYNVQRLQMAVCMISALLTGLGGALYPGRSAFATPDLMLWTVSGELIIMVHDRGASGRSRVPSSGAPSFVLLQEKVSSYVDWYFMVNRPGPDSSSCCSCPEGCSGSASSSAAADGATTA